MDEETESLIEAIRGAPRGTFKLFRATEAEPEVEQSMRNWSEVSHRIAHARAARCFIEVVSLRIQHMDVWLRIFFENTPHVEGRQREFGRLLRQCYELGLDKQIYDKLTIFNRRRIAAIHGYMVGKCSYEQPNEAVADTDGLAESLCEFVVTSSGEIVDESFVTASHDRGDMVFDIPKLLDRLRTLPAF